MQNRSLVGAIVGAIAFAGCANMTESQKGTATGAGIGAAAGAAIGALAGGGKGAAIGAGIGAAAGAGGGYLWSQHMQEQKQAMEAATQGTGVVVTQTPNNELKLEIPRDISFDLGKADLKPALRPVLDKFAQTLQANPGANVRIIGHTDSTGTNAVNDALSARRAASARDYLTACGGGNHMRDWECGDTVPPFISAATSYSRAVDLDSRCVDVPGTVLPSAARLHRRRRGPISRKPARAGQTPQGWENLIPVHG